MHIAPNTILAKVPL